MDDSKDCCEPSRPEYTNTELYVGTKIVKGVPMTETDFCKNIKKQDISDRETYGDGYMVTLAGRQKKYLNNAIGYFLTKKSIWLKMSYCKSFGFVRLLFGAVLRLPITNRRRFDSVIQH